MKDEHGLGRRRLAGLGAPVVAVGPGGFPGPARADLRRALGALIIVTSIASCFVEKRLMEGKGMEKIPLKNHIVVRGWNVNGTRLLEGIYRDTNDGAAVVLSISSADFKVFAEEDFKNAHRIILNIAKIIARRLRKTNEDVKKLTTVLSIALSRPRRL